MDTLRLFTASPFRGFVLGSDGRVLAITDRLALALGLDPASSAGRRLGDLFAGGDATQAARLTETVMAAAVGAAAAGPAHATVSCSLSPPSSPPDGSWTLTITAIAQASVEPSPGSASSPCFLVSVDEPTAPAERAIADERGAALADAIADNIWDYDVPTGRVHRTGRSGRVFGYPIGPETNTTSWWRAHLHHDDATRVLAALEAAVTHPDTVYWEDEYRFRRRDGSYAHVVDRGKILRGAAGRACRMVGGMTDQTERRILDDRLHRAQRLESIGTLAGGIAHDLNNVLTPLMLSVSLLRDVLTDPDLLAIVETIDGSARRGADLVNQVQVFARGSEGRPTLVRPAAVVHEIAAIARDTFPKHIHIGLGGLAAEALVLIDPLQLQQVLLTLAVNARDAMPLGGRLTLAVEVVELDEHYAAMLEESAAGRYVLISVVDDGVGMSRPVRERIFDPFFTTKDVGQGTGLGLSTALAIIRGRGGFIHVDSTPDRGSTFRVFLPLVTEGAPTHEERQPSAAASGRDELVLVVDDELAVRTLMARALRAHGYRVLLAADGAEALGLFVECAAEVAVVVTDLMMPVMDGRATIRALRHLRPDVPIIATSGHRADTGPDRTGDLGTAHFLLKPYTAETLVQRVRQVIDAAAVPPAAR